jgi:hypothetical protein
MVVPDKRDKPPPSRPEAKCHCVCDFPNSRLVKICSVLLSLPPSWTEFLVELQHRDRYRPLGPVRGVGEEDRDGQLMRSVQIERVVKGSSWFCW